MPGASGRWSDAALGDERGHEPGRRHVERRVVDRGARRARPARRSTSATSASPRSSIGMSAPSRVAGSIGRGRRGHVERHVVGVGQHRERVRADLVGDVAVGGDPIGTDHHRVDGARGEQRPGGGVDEHPVRDAEPVELPRGEPRALEHRAGLVDPHRHVRPPSCAARIDPERGPVPHAGERAGVAVREHATRPAAAAQRRAHRAHGCAATSAAAIASAASSAAVRAAASASAASASSTPHARFTAVGRADAQRRGRVGGHVAPRPHRRPPRARRRTRRSRRAPARPGR